MSEVFDDIVIGGGQAGPSLAARLAGAGRRVALIERRHLGGTCINTGCRPTKTLIASARVAAMARRAAEFGVTAGPVAVDLAAVRARVGRIVLDGRQGLADWLAGVPGVTLIRGQARFTGPKRGRGRRCGARGRTCLHQCRRPRRRPRPARGARRAAPSPAATFSPSTCCPGIWWWWAAATSAWSSPRPSGASAPR